MTPGYTLLAYLVNYLLFFGLLWLSKGIKGNGFAGEKDLGVAWPAIGSHISLTVFHQAHLVKRINKPSTILV